MNKFFKIGIGVVIVLGVVMMGWALFTSKTSESKPTEPTYLVATVAEQEPLLLEGSVETEKEKAYTVDPQKGEVTEVYVTDGQKVSAGDELFGYENETVSEEVADMRRQLGRLEEERSNLYSDMDKQVVRKNQAAAQAQKTVQPVPNKAQGEDASTNQESAAVEFDASAFDQGIEATQKAIREMNHSIEDLQMKIDRLQGKSNTVVKADFDGVVTVNEDGKSNPQIAFVKVTSQNSEVKSSVSEYDYESLVKGEAVTIYVKAQDRDIKGELTYIATDPMGASASSTSVPSSAFGGGGGTSSSVSRYEVITKPEMALPNGFTVQVKVPQSGIVIVEQAVQKEGNQEYVFTAKNGIAHKQSIKRVKRGVQWIVTEGLKVGDDIVVNPDEMLQEGQSVITAQSTNVEKAHD